MPRMSEARFNDLVYLTLKQLFFQPMFGEGASPRECDIRVVMNLVDPSTWKGNPLAAAILSPAEQAPASHTAFYDVDPQKVFEAAVGYMEDHWLKATVEEAFQDEGVRQKMLDFLPELVRAVESVPEDQCGPQTAPAG